MVLMGFGWSSYLDAMKITVATLASIERPFKLPSSATYLYISYALLTVAAFRFKQCASSLIRWWPFCMVLSLVESEVRSDQAFSSLGPFYTTVESPKSLR